MASLLLWLAGIALELVILFRFVKCRLFRHYPLFFIYLAIVLASSIILWPIYASHRSAYAEVFWAKQFLSLLAGFGVLLEIAQKSFQKYPGAKLFATLILAGMFTILCGYFAYRLLGAPAASLDDNFASLERDFRAMQAITLAGVVVLISHYRIDVGRNLRGIISGLGLYVGCTILSIALRGYAGASFDKAWNVIQPYAYLVALLIWTITLWSYAPDPTPVMPKEMDRDYAAFSSKTKEALGTMRAAIGKAERP